MITVSGLTKSYGARVLFRDVTFQVSDGRRIALVGGNGAGKTTLLEIVLGTTEADDGEVQAADRPSLPVPGDHRVAGRLGARRGAGRAARSAGAGAALARLHDDLATTSGGRSALAVPGEAQSRFEALGAAVEAAAHRVLAGLGFAGRRGAALTDSPGMRRPRSPLLAQPDVLNSTSRPTTSTPTA
jgi:ATP-binding cassette subfamily F protein 3